MTGKLDTARIFERGDGFVLFSLPEEKDFMLAALSPSEEKADLFITGFDSERHPLRHFRFDAVLKIDAAELDNIHPTIPSLHLAQAPGHVASREEHLSLVRKAILEIEAGQLEKVVCARISLIEQVETGDLFRAISRLRKAHPSAFTYLLHTPQTGCWIGASPELLLSRKNGSGETMSLAGTLAWDSSEQWGDKEFREQALVTKYIVDRLRKSGCRDIETFGPTELQAGKVRHLCTRIGFTGGPDTIDLALDLHPTPAVSGMAVKDAVDFIRRNENHDREWYSGFIGIRESAGNEQVFVNLRCGKLVPPCVEVHTGGGIVAGSDPEKEWEETERKASTLRRAFEKM